MYVHDSVLKSTSALKIWHLITLFIPLCPSHEPLSPNDTFSLLPAAELKWLWDSTPLATWLPFPESMKLGLNLPAKVINIFWRLGCAQRECQHFLRVKIWTQPFANMQSPLFFINLSFTFRYIHRYHTQIWGKKQHAEQNVQIFCYPALELINSETWDTWYGVHMQSGNRFPLPITI